MVSSNTGVSKPDRAFEIRAGSLESPQVIALLQDHLDAMEHTAPPESRHALDISGLRGPGIAFWSIWDGTQLAGVGALQHLSVEHAEIKSMKTASAYLRTGVAKTMLQHLIDEAVGRGYSRLSLETGSMEFFAPARKLYNRFGFRPCEPFGAYLEDPNSVFMTMPLAGEGANGDAQC